VIERTNDCGTTYGLYTYEYNRLPNMEDNEEVNGQLQVNKESYK
jgi:hypothetical protein